MKFFARFPGDSAAGVELQVEAPPPAYEIGVEGRVLSGHAQRLGAGVWSLVTAEGRQVEARVEHAPGGARRVRIGAASFEFELLDELTARALAATGGRSARRAAHATAAMPGRVLRVLVSPGDRVTQGQPLLMLEAMKMENEVKSPRDGVVASVEAGAGKAVSAGDVLVRFEAGGE